MDTLMKFVDLTGHNAFGWIVWFFIGSGLVQLSPIKINPWSWIAKKLGEAINGEVISKVSGLENDIAKIRDQIGMNEAVTVRVRILRFNDEILLNVRHSKDSFNQVLSDIDTYEAFCDEHRDFKNNRAVLAVQNIKETYKKCLKEHDFL